MFATLGGATLGGAALGTGASPVASGLSIRLAGADLPATWVADELRIAESVEQRAVCDLTIRTRSGPARVEPGTRLDADYFGVRLFSGTVERTVDAILPGSHRAVEIKLTAVDASQIADRRLITDRIDFALDDAHPTGWRADTIARTLVHSYLAGEGVTAYSTDCGSLVTAAFAFQSVAQALTQLAEATGSVWKIGPTRDLTFGPRTLNMAPLAIVQDYATEVRSTPGLVGYWRLGEASGATTAVDLGPNGLHGTYTGQTSLGAPGLIDGDADTAVHFDGTSAWVAVPSHAALTLTGPLTWGGWVVTETHSFPVNHRMWMTALAATYLSVQAVGSLRQPFMSLTIAGSQRTLGSGVHLDVGTRAHVVGLWDQSAMALYVNGTLAASTAVASGALSFGTAGLFLGRYTSGSEWTWHGRVDEAFIADRALTADEIRAHYLAGLDAWTHRPTLEAVRVERTRERLRTVQVARSDAIQVAYEDACANSAGWFGWNSGRNAVDPGGNPGPSFLMFDGGRVFRDIGMAPGDTLELDVYLQFNNNTPEFSIRFLSNSAGDGLNFRVGNTASQWYGLAVAPSQPSSGNGLFNAPAAVNTWHRVRIETSETSAAAYLDGVHYHTVVHSNFGGFIHLADIFPSVRYDNIVLYPGSASFTATVIDTTAVASIQAIEGGTGRYEVLELSSLTRTAEVTSTAAARLRRFSTPPTILTFETDVPGFRAGQLLPVHLGAFEIHDDYLIESVDIRLDGGVGRLLTRVQAVSDEQQGNVSDFWQQVAR